MHANPIAPGGVLIREESVLNFPDGIPGFESAKRFALVTVEELKPFVWLAALDEPAVWFLLVDPRLADPDYAPGLDPAALARLGARRPEEVVLFAMAAFKAGEAGVTVNLKAPVAIHPEARRGAQILLPDPRLGTRHPIAPRRAAHAA